jgi:HK97 family phage major capsid protein
MTDKTQLKELLAETIGEAMSGVKEMVAEAVDKAVEEKLAKTDKIVRKDVDPTPDDEPEGDEPEEAPVEGEAKIMKFINAVSQKDKATIKQLVGTKALVAGSDTAGGYLVPEEFTAELIRIAEDFGLVRRMARRIPMSSDTRNIPRLTTSVQVYWPGENTAGTPSDPVFGNVQLLAKTVVGLTVISNELLEDSNPEIAGILMELFAEALAGEEDKQGLVGSGSPFTGVLGDTNVTTVTMASGKTAFADVDADDLRDLIAQIKPLALGGAGFKMHRTVWATVQKLKDGANAYIATTSNPIVGGNASIATGAVGTVWGYPVYLSEKMPSATAVDTKYIIFGNLKYLFLGDRKTVTMAISDSATVGSDNVFEQNSSAVRVTERIALAVGVPSAFAVLKTSAT